ncbi:hypothetical protein [Mucilaginibacter sp.]|uniref:coiled-coil domain-containing protein n=1 Tax=Mucilaginibacter sp. TaxID=1882438 RepID=UPI00261FD9C8|nr:hypothetical protein [Mucilaginibacter sp.]MDB4919607.1 hypothetical protein [Mucilaginibacter sp.]
MPSTSMSRRDFLKNSTIFGVSVSPVIKPLSRLFGIKESQAHKLIDFGLRLIKPESLLSLEFYFINVDFREGCLFSKTRLLSIYEQPPSYMIVRLPQQHIAEQAYDTSTKDCGCKFLDTDSPDKDWIAKVVISGYSYIVFQLLQDRIDKKLKIPVTEKDLFDWNNEDRYHLVIRQNLNESLFNIKIESEAGKYYENTYPLNYKKSGTSYTYDINRFPKAYGDPITAIEAPWRLIISPKLPDPRQFRFKWIFTNESSPGDTSAELWMATLTVEPRPVIQAASSIIGDDRKADQNADQIFSNLNLMFIGSPDHPNHNINADDYFQNDVLGPQYKVLPYSVNRYALVELYIKYKLLAHSNNISFSPLGISAYIEFKNTRINDTVQDGFLPKKIDLYSYKHLISFGRDEGVEVTELILEKESGLKMLLILTTKRRTKDGISYLDYREYIKPLEIEKDYTSHVDGEGISKFRSPFKKIRFLEKDPRRICSIGNDTVYTAANSNLKALTNGKVRQGIFYPLTSDAKGNYVPLTFQMEITDWHDHVFTIRKKIQAITFGTNDRIEAGDGITLADIYEFFDNDNSGGTVSVQQYEAINTALNNNYQTLVTDVRNFAQGTPATGEHTFFDKTVAQIIELKSLLPSGSLGEVINSRKNDLVALLVNKRNQFKKIIQDKINMITLDTQEYLNSYTAVLEAATAAEKDVQDKITALKLQIDTDTQNLSAGIKTQLDDLAAHRDKIKPIQKEFKSAQGLIDDTTADLNKANSDLANIDPSDTDAIARQKAKIKAFQDLLQNYRAAGKALLLQHEDELAAEALGGYTNITKLLNSINTKLAQLQAQINKLQTQIDAIKAQVQARYQDQLDLLDRLLIEAGDKVDAATVQVSNNVNYIVKSVKSSSYLLIVEYLEKWFDSLKSDFENKEKDYHRDIDTGVGNLFDPSRDTEVQASLKAILDLKTNLPKIDIIDIDGKAVVDLHGAPVKFDLTPVLSDYLDGLISAVKLLFFDFTYRYLRPLADYDKELFNDIKGFRDRFKIDVLGKINDLKAAERSITNAIYTYRSKIGYAVNKFEDELEEINGSLSALETDFFVLKGELRTMVNKSALIDFFHQYSSMPQMKHAEVYVSGISKLVNQEIAVGMNYADDYIASQKDLYNLNIEKNATRVFAEIKEFSKNEIKSVIRKLSPDFGGLINPELAVDFLSYLRDPRKVGEHLLKQLPADLQDRIAASEKEIDLLKGQVAQTRAQINAAVNATKQQLQQYKDQLQQQINAYKDALNATPLVKDLVLIGSEAKSYYDEAKSFSPDAYFKNLEAKIFGTIYLNQILGIDFELPKLSPGKDEITYNFITNKIQSKDFDFFRFVAESDTQIQVYFSKSLKAAGVYNSFTRLSNFRLVIRLVSEDVLLIKFREFRIGSSNTQSRQIVAKLDGVAFGGPLDFFGKLAEKLQLPGTGLRIKPSANQLEIGYGFPLPSISAPGFNFANIKFNVGVIIPFATSASLTALKLVAGINAEDDKFLVSVGIFGGAGYFNIEAYPDSLESINAGVAFGGYFGINLGIASGYVFLFAGISLSYARSGNMTLVGYLICEGGVTVFGFISIYLTVMLSMTYQRIDGQAALYGSASLRYSIKIGFFKKSFEISFSKTFVGAKGASIGEQQNSAYLYNKQTQVYYASTEKDPAEYASYQLNYLQDETIPESNKDEHSALFEHIYSDQDWKFYYNAFDL